MEHLCLGALLVELGGGPSWGAWKGVRLLETYVLKKALKMDISLHRAH
jgi:hypothetical protein